MSLVKIKKPLLKTAIIGGVVLSSISMYLQKSIENSMRNTSSYQEAMEILHSEEFTRQYLGEPISDRGLNFFSSSSHGTDGNWRWIMLGVQGSNQKAYFKYWFSSDNKGSHKLLKVALFDIHKEEIFNKYVLPIKQS